MGKLPVCHLWTKLTLLAGAVQDDEHFDVFLECIFVVIGSAETQVPRSSLRKPYHMPL